MIGMGGMGHRVAAELANGGHELLTSLEGRSALSKERAAEAGARDTGPLSALVGEADILLSIMPPEDALSVATEVAAVCVAKGAFPLYVDCNAVSPETSQQIGDIIVGAGGRYIDAGIIGMPPQNGQRIRLFVSGDNLEMLTPLDGHGLDLKPVGPHIGQASGLKMCYAALTKGQMTLHSAVLMLAHALDLYEPFSEELSLSQTDAWQRMQVTTPFIAPDSGRWVGEMHEIAATFRGAHLPTGFHEAAAKVFEAASATPLAQETRETAKFDTPLPEVVKLYTDACQSALKA